MSMMQRMLQKHSFIAEYMYRAAGEDVIEKVREYKPDLIILEATVGPEGALCQRIKSDGRAGIPVIIMAGNISSDKDYEDCGADEVISKPLNREQILSSVNRLLKLG